MTYYQFRREDNGQIVEVSFQKMMAQVGGYITLECGVTAKRVYDEEVRHEQESKSAMSGPAPAIISDAMGFTASQLPDFEADRVKNGFDGVSFHPDPLEPTFYQAKFSSWKEWERYVRHRGMVDNNGKNGGGAILTADQFERAKQRVLEDAEERGFNGGDPSAYRVEGGEVFSGTLKIGIGPPIKAS